MRLPQSKEELNRAVDEIIARAESARRADEYKDRPDARKPRRPDYRMPENPRQVVEQWLDQLSVMGALMEQDLLQHADRAVLRWPEELRALAGRDIVRIIVRRRWARTHY